RLLSHPHSFPTRRSSDLDRRTRLGWTQAQLAVALSDGGVPGMSGTAVGRMETGQRSVRLSEGPVLAAVLGFPLHELVDIPESHRSEEHTSELQSRFDLVC